MFATLLAKTTGLVPFRRTEERRPVEILLVEDNEEQANLTRFLIASGGGSFDITWKPTLLDAMKYLRTSRPDVVLLDLGMPELTGWATLTAIRATAPEMPVVVLTAIDSIEVMQRTLDTGARYYLVKQKTDSRELRRCLWRAANRAEEADDSNSVEQEQRKLAPRGRGGSSE